MHLRKRIHGLDDVLTLSPPRAPRACVYVLSLISMVKHTAPATSARGRAHASLFKRVRAPSNMQLIKLPLTRESMHPRLKNRGRLRKLVLSGTPPPTTHPTHSHPAGTYLVGSL
jgi:hypothetical protein